VARYSPESIQYRIRPIYNIPPIYSIRPIYNIRPLYSMRARCTASARDTANSLCHCRRHRYHTAVKILIISKASRIFPSAMLLAFVLRADMDQASSQVDPGYRSQLAPQRLGTVAARTRMDIAHLAFGEEIFLRLCARSPWPHACNARRIRSFPIRNKSHST
jgi:hypothetical protein